MCSSSLLWFANGPKYNLSVTDDLCIITIISEIVYLNHEILDQYSDKSKPTLYKIAGVDLVVKDFLLVMPANTDFNLVDNSFSVFTVCMFSMSSTVQCVNDFEQSTLL